MQFSKKLIIPAIIIVLLGVMVAAAPWTFAPVCEVPTDENPDGLWVMTKAGKQLPMPCGYTARAELGVGAGIAVVGGMLLFATTLGVLVALAAVVALMGATAIALPTTLTGTCALTSHSCNTTTLPTLEVLGIVLIVVAIGLIVFRKKFKV